MSKKSKTSTVQDSTSHLVTTPNNPAFVDQGLAGIGGRITDYFGKLDPYSLVAGPDALQTQAGSGAAGLTGTPWAYDASSGIAGGVANAPAPSIAGHLKEFQDPWNKQVVDTTLAGFDHNAGYSRARDSLARAGDSTFGGSGGAIQTALNEQNIGRDRAMTEADLRSQGYRTALGGATSQAGYDSQAQAQRLAAAGLISSNANDYGANSRANISTQNQIGEVLRLITQARQQAPISGLGAEAGLWGSLPLNLVHGTTADATGHATGTGTSTESDPIGQLSKLLQAIGSLRGGGGGGGGDAGGGGQAAAAGG